MMKLVITASVVLFLVGWVSTFAWTSPACTTQDRESLLEAAAKNEATVTLVVRGMMKSKSGAT